mmetsp:Transcript_70913/g.207789  ORF Transcript_70913/g.207789 Transcript_70913/m.207789 type:complete len:288 (+) Transcript_70913:299-1162(+)
MDLEELQGLFDEVSEVLPLPLGVVDPITDVVVLVLEDVEDREDLPVVRHQSLADHVPTQHQGLQDLEGRGDDVRVAGVQRHLDRDDELGHDGQDLGAALLEHVVHALDSEEAVGLLLLADAVEEDGQVVVVVQLIHVDLPGDLAAHRAVEDLDGQVPAVVEAPELGAGHRPVGGAARGGGPRGEAPRGGAEAREGGVHGALVLGRAGQRGRGGALRHLRLHLAPGARREVRGEVAQAAVLAQGDHALLLQALEGLGAVLVHHVLESVIKDERAGKSESLHLYERLLP